MSRASTVVQNRTYAFYTQSCSTCTFVGELSGHASTGALLSYFACFNSKNDSFTISTAVLTNALPETFENITLTTNSAFTPRRVVLETAKARCQCNDPALSGRSRCADVNALAYRKAVQTSLIGGAPVRVASCDNKTHAWNIAQPLCGPASTCWSHQPHPCALRRAVKSCPCLQTAPQSATARHRTAARAGTCYLLAACVALLHCK